MWFKLTNADFSGNNLGTMSSLSNSWSVSKMLGPGATYSGPTSVTKGGAFSATITLGTNYEIATSGITFTMGGVAQSTYSTSGSTIAFTINSVTGNIVIKVPTKSTASSGGDSGISLTSYATVTGCPDAAGHWLTSSPAARKSAVINVEGKTKVILSKKSSYKYNISAFSSVVSLPIVDVNSLGYITDHKAWYTESPQSVSVPDTALTAAIGIARVDNSAVEGSTLADLFTSISLDENPLTLADYSVETGICTSGSGVWDDSPGVAALRKSAFVDVKKVGELKLEYDDSVYKNNIVFFSNDYSSSNDIKNIPSGNSFISTLGIWVSDSTYTYAIPSGAKSIVIALNKNDSDADASTLADAFDNIIIS